MSSRRGGPRTRARRAPTFASRSGGRPEQGRSPRARVSRAKGSRRSPTRPAPRRGPPRVHPQPRRGSVDQVLSRQAWDALRAPLERAGADVEPALERLRHYARLLLEWNRSVSNIMSRNDEPRIVDRHLLESIAPAYWLQEAGCHRWIDFGSGAGLPGIPLAIAGVAGHWTLVESRRTKTLFMRKTMQDIKLSDFEVVNDRLENFIQEPARDAAFDGFVSRATMRLGPTLEMAGRLVRPGGSAFLWKGSGYEGEMDQDPRWRSAWVHHGVVAIGSGPNVVVRFIRGRKE